LAEQAIPMSAATGINRASNRVDPALLKKLTARHRPSVARAITIVERGGSRAQMLLESIHVRTGNAYRVGITGPPGGGKSTLLTELAGLLCKRGATVGVIAVDPSSPFTQGAVLGDRVRMSALDGQDGIFIRSMASRGQSGGLSARTGDAADVLDAAGFDYVLVESVGVGQVGLDIEKLVDTTVVVIVPESGDQVQAIKAGLMEIADIYVVNKCDRPGSNSVLSTVQASLAFQHHHMPGWTPQVIRTVASAGEGIEDLAGELARHRDFLETNDLLKVQRRRRMSERVVQLLNELIRTTLWDDAAQARLNTTVDRIIDGELTPMATATRSYGWWVPSLVPSCGTPGRSSACV